ncbi:MAG: sigma-54 dependent transcriptional regulator [Polyangia bacterium]
MAQRVLVVDDEEGIRSFLAEVLAGEGHEVAVAADGREALALFGRQSFHLMITDLKMPGMDGMELFRRAAEIAPETEVIVLTAHGTVETAVEAMKLGAADYLTKPLSGPDELRIVSARALERRRMRDERQRIDAGEQEEDLIASDPVMRGVVEQLEKVAPTTATVLLSGESGTGKEIAARLVHRRSRRADGPFVAVNCAAISEQLVESEMLGHEKGAFTGATEQRRGRFELADGGTLFLDEIAELPAGLQAKLLRVLQERRFERVGGSRTIEVDVRLVAATNRDLEQELRAGRFREDLYHRLAVFPVRIPPLRERPADVEPLARHLLERIARQLGRPGLGLSKGALDKLRGYDWPGNVRELANALERAAILADGGEIGADDVVLGPGAASRQEPLPEGATLEDLERVAIERALDAVGGHRKKAAERLGIGLRTLYDKLKEYDLS